MIFTSLIFSPTKTEIVERVRRYTGKVNLTVCNSCVGQVSMTAKFNVPSGGLVGAVICASVSCFGGAAETDVFGHGIVDCRGGVGGDGVRGIRGDGDCRDNDGGGGITDAHCGLRLRDRSAFFVFSNHFNHYNH